MTTAKAIAAARELADNLKIWLAASMPVVSETFDTNGDPVITFSADATPVAGEKIVVIRVKAIDWPDAKDIFGNTAIKYGPHVFQVCTEANPAAGAGADILGAGDKLSVFAECARRGSFVEHYESAAATAPSTSQMTSANLKGTWKDLYFNILKAS